MLLQLGRSGETEEAGDARNDSGIEVADTEKICGDLCALFVAQ